MVQFSFSCSETCPFRAVITLLHMQYSQVGTVLYYCKMYHCMGVLFCNSGIVYCSCMCTYLLVCVLSKIASHTYSHIVPVYEHTYCGNEPIIDEVNMGRPNKYKYSFLGM